MNTPCRRTMMAACAIAVAITLLPGCTTGRKALHAADFLPPTPHYDDATQWYITDRHADADIFYITSTETGDYPHTDGTPCHYADTYIDSLRNPILGEMEGVDRLLSGALNFYSPYYRQCSIQTFTSDSTIAVRMPVATNDIKKAFRHYLKHLNNQRPFILAGYSQGAMILLELLKEMDKQTYSRMIAAYAVGVSIPKEVRMRFRTSYLHRQPTTWESPSATTLQKTSPEPSPSSTITPSPSTLSTGEPTVRKPRSSQSHRPQNRSTNRKRTR